MFNLSSSRRNQGAVGGAMFGLLLTIAGFPTLFLNEGRAVKTARALAEGSAAVVSVDAQQLDNANDGKLIHVTGEANTEDVLNDDEFGVTANAIRLARTVEMYQWREVEEKVTRKVDGKATTETQYAYEKTWSGEVLSSNSYHEAEQHANPSEMRFRSKTSEAKSVNVGQYLLSPELISKISQSEPLSVDLAHVPQSLAEGLRSDGGTATSTAGFYWSVTPPEPPKPASETLKKLELVMPETQPSDDVKNQEPNSIEKREPEIGDVRIRFVVTRPTDISVIAQQSGKSFQPYATRSGRNLCMLSPGIVSAEQMFDKAVAENNMFTWALRVFGTIFLVMGIGLVMRPLTSMTDRIPILGNLIGMGATLVAVLAGGALALLTISIAWLFYRPLVAIPLIAVAIGLLVVLFRLSKKPRPESEVAVEIVES